MVILQCTRISNYQTLRFKYIEFYLSLAPQNIWGKFFKKLSSVLFQAEWRNFTGPKTETQFGSIQQGFFEHLLCAKYSPRCLENSNEQQKLYSWLRCCIERKQVTRKTCVPAVAAGEKKKRENHKNSILRAAGNCGMMSLSSREEGAIQRVEETEMLQVLKVCESQVRRPGVNQR